MKKDNEASRGARSGYFSSTLLPASVFGGLLVLTLLMQLILSWQAHRRLVPATEHIARMARLQDINLALQESLLNGLRDSGSFIITQRKRLHRELQAILAMPTKLDSDTRQVLVRAHDVLADESREPKETLILALKHVRQAIDLETRAHQRLIQTIGEATTLEFQIGVITMVIFPAGAFLILYVMRKRILAPLNHLGFLMTLLGRRDYSPLPIAPADPILQPLTDNYNKMLTRLAALEQEHAQRENRLESQVNYATRTLLEQQRMLANTERLAAIGETMARIAHELRNPLAGIKLACTNLRLELAESNADADYIERVNMIAAELDRIITVLNSLLDQSRHSPEPLQDVELARSVADLVSLMRYQLPANIHLKQEIAADIVCRLPDAMLRQALLNLLLNAQQAIGEEGGEITLKSEIRQGMLCLHVIDDGPGFPDELLQTGVRSFVTHRPEGTGLGLSMVQRFVRAHGGRLSLSNITPHGACVTLEFPYEVKNV